MKTTHLAATYSTQPWWGALHKSAIAVSPDPLFPCEGLASEARLLSLLNFVVAAGHKSVILGVVLPSASSHMYVLMCMCQRHGQWKKVSAKGALLKPRYLFSGK